MTYEQYWYGDCHMIRAFFQAEKLRQESKNTELWLNGMYIYDAISRIAPILHPFAKKGTKAIPYLEKPYSTKKEDKVDEATQAQIAENERLKSILYFKNWARAAQKQFKDDSKSE